MHNVRKKRPFHFSLTSALFAMLVIGVGGGSYYGMSIRQRMREEEAEKQFLKQSAQLDKQRDATVLWVAKEHDRISTEQRPFYVRAQGGGGSRFNLIRRDASWKYDLQTSLDTKVLSAITVYGQLNGDTISAITIETGAGLEDTEIIERLKKFYDQHRWSYKVVHASAVSHAPK